MPKRARHRLLRLAAAAVAGLLFTCDGPTIVYAQAPPALATDEVTVETRAGGRHRFRVEIARTGEQQAQGLMFRTALAADAGMLFDYPQPTHVAIWMKNTLIPLDVIFIGRDGRIVRIYERAVPLSLATMASGEPVRAVLEVNGGTAERLSIRPGDRVVHPMFGSPRPPG